MWTALEQIPYITPSSNLHCCLGHEKMSFGSTKSHVKYNKCGGSLTVEHHFLADGIRELVSHWNKHADELNEN